MQPKVIADEEVAKERKKDFEISRINRFKHRTRYFTDSGIIVYFLGTNTYWGRCCRS